MAHYTAEADMPMLEVPGGTVFVIEAVSPTTGAAITSVAVTNLVIYGTSLGAGGAIDASIVPVLSSEQLEELGG